MIQRLTFIVFATFIALSAIPLPARAAYLENMPVTAIQPDGTSVDLVVTGDEFFRRVSDVQGFPVTRNAITGWIVYADTSGGALLPTPFQVGLDDPLLGGLRPNVTFDRAEIEALTRQKRIAHQISNFAPTKGTVINLMVFIRFADDPELLETYSDYETQFNGEDADTPSLLNYYREVSLGALDVKTVFAPPPDDGWVTAYTDPNSRSIYRTYDSATNPLGYTTDDEARIREHTMLANALAAVEAQIPEDVDIDADDDGFVDNVIFMVQGWPDAWSDLLWPHKWEFWTDVPFKGALVDTYNFQFMTLMLIAPATFAHEMFHSFGAPDLYHYSQDDLDPVGPWDVMGSTGVFAPQHMLSYMKFRYGGWLDEIPEITQTGPVTLHPSWADGTQAVKVAVAESTDEFFILEYRRDAGVFESSLPASGLLVYRINTREDGVGNRNGPPDEIYVLRPGGDLDTNGDIKKAPLSAESGRTRVNEVSDPAIHLQDNSSATLRVYDVGTAGDTITFQVCLVAPDCGERVCGDDGCGGSCGTCGNGDHCVGGACVPCSCVGLDCGDDGCGISCGECHDGIECTADLCETGLCMFTPETPGFTCSDQDLCTFNDACDGTGKCVGKHYACAIGTCEASSVCDGTGDCFVILEIAGTACDDGDFGTVDDVCDQFGTCAGTVPSNTDDGTGQDQWIGAPDAAYLDIIDPDSGEIVSDTIVDGMIEANAHADVVTDQTVHDEASSSCSGNPATGDAGSIGTVAIAFFALLSLTWMIRRRPYSPRFGDRTTA